MKLYTIPEAAEKWEFSTSILYREIRKGNLKAKLRRGNKKGYRVTDEIMEQWMEEGWEAVC